MRLDRSIKRIAANYRDWVSKRVILNSTAKAERMLPAEPVDILVDSNVHHHTVTHETGWISTGEKRFGPNVRGTGYAARVPVYQRGSKSKDYENICYLAAIAQLAKVGRAKLWTSHQLMLERNSHPRARFADVGWFDYNLFGRGELPSIDGDPFDEMNISPFSFNAPPPDDIKAVLSKSHDKLFLELKRVMGEGNSQDAWHIRTAEVNGMYCFLTMETSMLNIMHAQRNRPVIKNLRTRVMSPKMLGEELRLVPIELKHFDHQDSSWFVRSDLQWDKERRPSTRTAK